MSGEARRTRPRHALHPGRSARDPRGPHLVAGAIYPSPAIRGTLASVTDGVNSAGSDWHTGSVTNFPTIPIGFDFDFGYDRPVKRIDIFTYNYRLARCNFDLLDSSNKGRGDVGVRTQAAPPRRHRVDLPERKLYHRGIEGRAECFVSHQFCL